MRGGGDLWQIAGFLGMTTEMLERVYGHHHPDFQRAASEALGRSRRQERDRYNETEREQMQSGVAKIADKH